MLDFDELFKMHFDAPRAAEVFEFSPKLSFEERCGLLRGEVVASPVFTLKRVKGRSKGEIIETTSFPILLISSRVTDLISSFSGWRSIPVQLDASDAGTGNYSALSITGRVGPADESMSRIETQPPPSIHGRAYDAHVGLYFDPSSWDGSDFFLIEGKLFVCVTRQVATALMAEQIDGLVFTPLSEVKRRVMAPA